MADPKGSWVAVRAAHRRPLSLCTDIHILVSNREFLALGCCHACGPVLRLAIQPSILESSSRDKLGHGGNSERVLRGQTHT